MIVLLGGSGALGTALAEPLRRLGHEVVLAGRNTRCELGIDVLDERWHTPRAWDDLRRSDPRLAGAIHLVNLVTQKGEHEGASGPDLAAITALHAAARSGPEAPTIVHLGSATEFRAAGHLSRYGEQKRKAREDALTIGGLVVLTLPVVVGYRRTSASYRKLRSAVACLPELARDLKVALVHVDTVAAALSILQEQMALPHGWRGPREVTLRGRVAEFREYFDLPVPRTTTSEASLYEALRLNEGSHVPWIDRLASMCRLALEGSAGTRSNHYLHGTWEVAEQAGPAAPGGEHAGRGWVLHTAGAAGATMQVFPARTLSTETT